MATFFEQLDARVKSVKSLLCVGLDPHSAQLPEGERNAQGAKKFCLEIIEATKDVAAAYKPNAAFFEAYGSEGLDALKQVIEATPAGIPVVLDAKRGDIGSTCAAYAQSAFEELKAHCITLSPYMGYDSISPFLEDSSKGCFVLCKTSNKSSADFQTLKVGGGKTVYEHVAKVATEWNKNNQVGLVIGATDIEAIEKARVQAPDLWILAPGLGFQGGNLEEAVAAGLRSTDQSGILFPVSRGISKAADRKAEAIKFRDAINKVREEKKQQAGSSSAVTIPTKESRFIQFALDQEVLKFGEFTLKSGRVSPYFFNAGLFSSGMSFMELGAHYADKIVASGIEFDVLFGPAYKGITLASSIAIALASNHGRDVQFTYNRKEKKDHGEGGLLVGAPVAGKRVLVVDDVITAGTAIREAMGILEHGKANVVGVTVALDRQERGKEGDLSAIQEVEKQYSIPVLSVCTLAQLQQFIRDRDGDGSDLLARMTKYRSEYGSKEATGEQEQPAKKQKTV